MKPFRFTLEAVRTLRLRQEHQAMEQYAQTLLARDQAMKRLHGAQQALDSACQDMREKLSKGCAALEAARSAALHREFSKARDARAEDLALAERRVRFMLQAMLNARQQREITDKFHDNQKKRHQRGEMAEEQKFLDDLAGRRLGSALAWGAAGNQTL